MPNVTVNPIQTISVRVDSGKQTVVQSTSQFVGAQNPDIASEVAYLQATNNTQNASIIAIQSVNNTQNTNIQSAFDKANSATVLAQSAFDKANTGGGGGISGSGYLANSVIFANTTGYLSNTGELAYYTSNSTFVSPNISATSIYQNGVDLLAFSQSAFEQANTASANTIRIQGGLNAANANIIAIRAYANTLLPNTGSLITVNSASRLYLANPGSVANPALSIGFTNRGFYDPATGELGVIGGGWEQFRFGNTSTTVNYGRVSGAATNSSPVFSVAGTDTNIDLTLRPKGNGAVNISSNLISGNHIITGAGNGITFVDGTIQTTAAASNAYSQASFALANTLQGGLNTANASIIAIQGINVTQNSSISAIQDVNNTQNTNITILQGVNLTQNTNISNASGLAQSAFDNSNTKFNSSGGTISGSVTIQNNLIVQGNVNYVGNVNSIQVTGNTGQFFGYASNGFNALYAGIPIGYLVEPQTVYQMTGNYDGYAALNMQNINTGPNSSFDLFITADNGSVTDGFLDLGLGSSNYNYPGYSLLGRNDGYLFVTGNTTTGGGNMIVGTGLNNDVVFATGGLNVQNEVMRISGTPGSNTVIIKSNISSTTTQTGALQVRGGLGVTGNVYAGNVYSGGTLVLTSEPIGVAAFAQANSKTFTFTQNTAPTTANTADRWVQIDTGVVYQNFGNTANPVWAEFGPGGTVSNTSNATVPSAYSNQYVLTGTTTGNVETEIFVSPTFTRIPVAANTVVYYTADITCRRTDVSGDYGSFFLKGVAANSSTGVVSNVGLIYELIVARTDANFLVDLQADNTNKSVKVLVTGATGKTLSWKCVINTVEV